MVNVVCLASPVSQIDATPSLSKVDRLYTVMPGTPRVSAAFEPVQCQRIGIGGQSGVLPSHTTVHAGPHTAVRRVELGVNSQAFCIVGYQETPPNGH
jgi:hypothetical protein